MNNLTDQNEIFPRGDQGPADYFNGTAWVKILVPKDQTGTYAVGNVVFEPGCRNNWHTHATGQILLITDGKAFTRKEVSPQGRWPKAMW